MPSRPSSELATLFASLVDELRIELSASVERSLADFSRRLTRLERRLDELEPAAASRPPSNVRSCSLCERPSMARGLCSAHYQQWRYRQRKQRLTPVHGAAVGLPSKGDLSGDN